MIYQPTPNAFYIGQVVYVGRYGWHGIVTRVWDGSLAVWHPSSDGEYSVRAEWCEVQS